MPHYLMRPLFSFLHYGLAFGLAVAAYFVLVGAKLFEAHGAAGVELVGGYADFRAEAEFKTVGETRGGVPVDGRAVDAVEEFLGGLAGFGYD